MQGILKETNILDGLIGREDEILVNELLQGTLPWYLYVTVQGSIGFGSKGYK